VALHRFRGIAEMTDLPISYKSVMRPSISDELFRIPFRVLEAHDATQHDTCS